MADADCLDRRERRWSRDRDWQLQVVETAALSTLEGLTRLSE